MGDSPRRCVNPSRSACVLPRDAMTPLAAASTSDARVPSLPASRAACCASRTMSHTLACFLEILDLGRANVWKSSDRDESQRTTRTDLLQTKYAHPSDIADIAPERASSVDQYEIVLAELAVRAATVRQRCVLCEIRAGPSAASSLTLNRLVALKRGDSPPNRIKPPPFFNPNAAKFRSRIGRVSLSEMPKCMLSLVARMASSVSYRGKRGSGQVRVKSVKQNVPLSCLMSCRSPRWHISTTRSPAPTFVHGSQAHSSSPRPRRLVHPCILSRSAPFECLNQ